jgi:ankyrin repeat protein
MCNLVAAGADTKVPGLIAAAAQDRTGMAISTIKRMNWEFDRTHINAALMAGVSGLPNSVLHQLVEWGADPMAASASGETPLSVAYNLARHSAVKFFIEQGAQLTEKMRENAERLVISAIKPDTDDSRYALRFLLEGGFEVPQKIQGRTVMQFVGKSSEDLKRLIRSHALGTKLSKALSDDGQDAAPPKSDAGFSL